MESLNARYRRAIKARGHFPSEGAALKCLYLVTRSLDPKGTRPDPVGRALETRSERVRSNICRQDARPQPRLGKLALRNSECINECVECATVQ